MKPPKRPRNVPKKVSQQPAGPAKKYRKGKVPSTRGALSKSQNTTRTVQVSSLATDSSNLAIASGPVISIVSDAHQEPPFVPFRIQDEMDTESPNGNAGDALDRPRGAWIPPNPQPGPSGMSPANNNLGSKAIWFVGSSIVYWAQTNAKTRHGGPNIGLQSRGVYIRWFGKRGMLWNDFNAKVLHAVEKFSPPAMIVIQLGSNDLVKVKTLELIQNIVRDILRLHLLLPNTRIVWSEMLMRRYWHGATDGKAIERSRKRVNSAINNYVLNDGHCIIQHPNIRAQELNLYRYDGTHLSDIGYNIYLNNIQGGIETFLSSPKIRRFPEV
ncbi:uncharacterized protein LOC134720647 isoform X1 [Mytilus trossulus]|uniref:uncharacterized protein LOC134720647 isoform X1 n=1 Tax=Mytilus trossulus TaxID=6551 RepID=UPI0030076720